MPKKSKYQIESHHQDEIMRQSQIRSKNNVPEDDFDRHYDLTPLGTDRSKRKDGTRSKHAIHTSSVTQQSYPIDPWEIASPIEKENDDSNELKKKSEFHSSSCRNGNESVEHYTDECLSSEDDVEEEGEEEPQQKSTFVMPSDIHPRMEEKEDEIAQLRLLAGKLNADWRGTDFMAPALARRIRDFQFAQEKRRKKFGHEKPWGILGLYDHLASIRVDVEWAEDAAWRRANGQP